MVGEIDASLRDLSFEERLGIMVDKSGFQRRARIQRILLRASLGVNACVENIDYTVYRTIDKKTIQTLWTCSYIEQKLNIVISGKTGSANSISPVPKETVPVGMAIPLNTSKFRNSC